MANWVQSLTFQRQTNLMTFIRGVDDDMVDLTTNGFFSKLKRIYRGIVLKDAFTRTCPVESFNFDYIQSFDTNTFMLHGSEGFYLDDIMKGLSYGLPSVLPHYIEHMFESFTIVYFDYVGCNEKYIKDLAYSIISTIAESRNLTLESEADYRNRLNDGV